VKARRGAASVRWVVLGLTSLACAIGAWALLRARAPRRSVELQIDTGGYDPRAPTAIPAEDATLPSAAEVAHARWPASTFRRSAWNAADFPQPTTARNNPLRFDPQAGFTFSGGMDRRREWAEHPDGGWSVRTNSLGLRDDDEPSAVRPDLRVVVLGDSHSAGFCNNKESFAQLLEASVAARRPGNAIEVLNAAVPGYTFVHHLGALERLLPLEPDVAVVVIYGGNDFVEALGHHHKAHGTARGDLAQLERRLEPAQELDPELVAQALLTVEQFRLDPAQLDVALQAARDVTTEIAVTCQRHGIVPLFVYLPSTLEVEFPRRRERFEAALAALGAAEAEVQVLARLADPTLAFLRSFGLATLDLRPALATAQGKLYWDEDFHLALDGHAVVARELASALERLAPADAQRIRRGAPALAGDAARQLLSPGAGLPAVR
jgi:lysophospholipase L1-like esterase